MNTESALWEKIYKLHENGENISRNVQKFYDYWDGKYEAPGNSHFKDQSKTSCNIIKQIVEAKLTATLDAQFSVNVVPKLNVFADISTVKEQNNYADVLNSELTNILNNNRFDDLKEKLCRWGLVCGLGGIQTTFDTSNKTEGEICLNIVEPKTLRWDKHVKNIKDLTFISYNIELNPSIAKKRYATNPDGTINERMSKRIDELADIKSDTGTDKKQRKGVVAIESNESADLAYVYETNGINSGKIINLIVIFLLDDSLYYPSEKDNPEDEKEKMKARAKYPNGRMIVCSAKEEHQLILEDKPAPQGFKNLGNIDMFKPLDFDNIYGKGEVEDLIPIQDRINGTYLKVRELIATHINILAYFKGVNLELNDGDFINHPVVGLEGTAKDGVPITLDNGTITYALKLIEYIKTLKEEAQEIARTNPTMINGMRQPGTTSGEQVEALQESPMGAIRTIQRNFKDTVISVGEKIITLIQNNYNIQRLIKLSTCLQIDDKTAMYAKFSEQDSQRYIELLNEAAKTIKTIKIDKNWEFNVEVVAGTEIPRSRRENANLAKQFVDLGVLNLQDPDMLELYMKSLDIPNYRAYVSLMKKKKEDNKNKPEPLQFLDIIKNPVIATAFSELVKSLNTNSQAKGQLLQSVGLTPNIDKLEDAPIQSVTSKSELEDVATIAPELISKNPERAAQAQEISSNIVTLEEANL
jgi:hypothetical protein